MSTAIERHASSSSRRSRRTRARRPSCRCFFTVPVSGAQDLCDLGHRSVFEVTERDDLRLSSGKGPDGRPELRVIGGELGHRDGGPPCESSQRPRFGVAAPEHRHRHVRDHPAHPEVRPLESSDAVPVAVRRQEGLLSEVLRCRFGSPRARRRVQPLQGTRARRTPRTSPRIPRRRLRPRATSGRPSPDRPRSSSLQPVRRARGCRGSVGSINDGGAAPPWAVRASAR